MPEFIIKQGDLEPGIEATLSDTAGVVDLTEAVTVQLRFATHGGTVLWTRDMTVDDPLTGTVFYAWQAGDTDTIGSFRAEVVVTWIGNRPQTWPGSGYVNVGVLAHLG